MGNIVDDVTGWAQELGLARDQALALQNRICREWGGCKPYVPKRPAERHAAAVGQQLAQGSSLEQAFTQAGISRRQGYRILSRPLVKPR